MESSLRALLGEIVDYAGMFPPAQLRLEEALKNYGGYRASSERWMLARFVCSADRLEDLAKVGASTFSADSPGRVTVIAKEDPLSPEALRDIRLLDQFARLHGDVARAEAVEWRVSGEVVRTWTPEAIAEGLNVLANRLIDHGFADIEVYLEAEYGTEWQTPLQKLVRALQMNNQEEGAVTPNRIGFKLRTGGLKADAFPRVKQVAVALETCRDSGIPMKFTAGLHHPFRRFDQTVQTHVHGFINVFVAGVLAKHCGLGEEAIGQLLEVESAEAIAFDERGLAWNGHTATIDEIEEARREFVVSFGSCSFDEPREDLKGLGWL